MLKLFVLFSFLFFSFQHLKLFPIFFLRVKWPSTLQEGVGCTRVILFYTFLDVSCYPECSKFFSPQFFFTQIFSSMSCGWSKERHSATPSILVFKTEFPLKCTAIYPLNSEADPGFWWGPSGVLTWGGPEPKIGGFPFFLPENCMILNQILGPISSSPMWMKPCLTLHHFVVYFLWCCC